ncbi:hypothetical protein T07_9689 [Trichinella nelsoni]|uniref:Uncharacterized protein n=1 Tax=Trichinella nelsoni TaxID=6336 RepID=A0A0V0RDP5_9BILA|nr:hypothetical protein T07_9689 [Trichinella nelsoni]
MDLVQRKNMRNTSRKHLILLFLTIFWIQNGRIKANRENPSFLKKTFDSTLPGNFLDTKRENKGETEKILPS